MRDVPELDAFEREALFRIIDVSLRIKKRHHFFMWVQMELQNLLPHEILICGLSDADGKAMHLHSFTSTNDFTDDHFKSISHPGSGLVARMMEIWRQTGKPCLLDSEHGRSKIDPLYQGIREQMKFAGLGNIAAHGIPSGNGRPVGFFSFSRVPEPLGDRHRYLLEILAPLIYMALVRALGQEHTSAHKIPLEKGNLTGREKEVLGHLRDGLSNRDIAELLQLSPFTVKSHVQKILHKLQASNRAHAITQAERFGLMRK